MLALLVLLSCAVAAAGAAAGCCASLRASGQASTPSGCPWGCSRPTYPSPSSSNRQFTGGREFFFVLSTLADREDYSSDHAMGVFMIQIDGTEAERGRKLVAVGVRYVTKLSYTVQGLQSIQKEDDMLDLQLWELLPKEDETFEVYKDELDR